MCQQKAVMERLKSEIRYLKFKDKGPVPKMTSEVISVKTSEAGITDAAAGDASITPTEVTETEQITDDGGETIYEDFPAEVDEIRKSKMSVSESRKSVEFEQEVMKFEDIFSRILKEVYILFFHYNLSLSLLIPFLGPRLYRLEPLEKLMRSRSGYLTPWIPSLTVRDASVEINSLL